MLVHNFFIWTHSQFYDVLIFIPPKESGLRAVLVWLGPARKSILSSVLRRQRVSKPGPVGGLTSGRQAAPSPFTDGALNTSFGAHHRACGILVLSQPAVQSLSSW